jgi:hypothetical protein
VLAIVFGRFDPGSSFLGPRFGRFVAGCFVPGSLFLAFGSWALCLLGVLGGSCRSWKPWEL